MILPYLPVLASAFDFDVRSGQGLTVTMNGVPVVRGSGFQYFAPGWSKGYYSSQYNTQTIDHPDADTVKQSFRSSDQLASGFVTYHRVGSDLRIHAHFEWASQDPAQIELNSGILWLPAVQSGLLVADGVPTRKLEEVPAKDAPAEVRNFSPGAKSYSLAAPIGKISLTSPVLMISIDGRNYNQDWATGRRVAWLGAESVSVAPGSPVDLDYVWHFDPSPAPTNGQPKLLGPGIAADKQVLTPDESIPTLIPQARFANLNWRQPLRLTGKCSFPAGRFHYFDRLIAELGRRFASDPVGKEAKAVDIDGGVSKLGFAPGGYKIAITDRSISVLGEEEVGLLNGIHRLAQIAFIKDGAVCLPTGDILDQPTSRWRGVHLFVGPEANDFHAKLWDRVLGPLGFNKVVLQCERTGWETIKGTETKETMSKADLKRLFDYYRTNFVEPIPLIQSLGHMEWFFANRQNLDLALNPEEPYQIDPRKLPAQQKVSDLWEEAIALLKPETIHFGLDEIDMRGMPTDDPTLTTQLWVKQVPFLGEIAKKHNARMMLWGDQALAPGEAPDAALGDNAADARVRRAAIPKGALIGDWHYMASTSYRTYLPSIRLWKDQGFAPIASTWYDPENVRGFGIAASIEGSGTLQTTWCGYTSNERAMLENPEQFSAMILAADFAWSGRQDPVSKLDYDPLTVLRRMYFGTPAPIHPLAGQCIRFGDTPKSVAGVKFLMGAPVTLYSPIGDTAAPESVQVGVNLKAKTLAFALDSMIGVDNNAVVGELVISLVNGKVITKTLRYGEDVRAFDDAETTLVAEREGPLSVAKVSIASVPAAVKSVTFRTAGSYAGLRIHGITAW